MTYIYTFKIKNMKKTKKFHNWFTSIGGTLSNDQFMVVDKILNIILLPPPNTLKHRSEEIKQQHNYIFNFKN